MNLALNSVVEKLKQKLKKFMEDRENIVQLSVNEINFHPVLKDIENMFWFFLLSVRALSDYDVQNILRTKDSVQEGYLCFVQMLDKFNNSTNLQIERRGNSATSKINILKEMVFVGKATAILIYDFLSVSDYADKIKEDEEFKFLKCIRNGAAHNNKFDLKYRYGKNKGQWVIDEKETIKWSNMIISRASHEKVVFNDFISLFSVFLLAKYFSERLTGIDNEQK